MLHVTPEMVEATYELLKLTKPFRGWKLPAADEVVFSVMWTERFSADYAFENGRHHIRVSGKKHRTLGSLIPTVAHEMCHMRDELKCVRSHHGASFKRMADQVCRYHHFDRGQF